MVEAEYAIPDTAHSAGPWIVTAIVVAFVVGSHVLAVRHCALPVYGYEGAEYIEHRLRMDAVQEFEATPLALQPISVPRLFQTADGPYPLLLHICAALWGSAFGHGIPSVLHLNVLFLLALAVAVAIATRNLPTMLGRERGSPWSASLAASTILLAPTFFGSARRYYYDLPMAMWTTIVFAAFCRFPLSPMAVAVGTIASAAALMTKWNAGFSLVPVWLVAAVVTLRDPLPRRRWRTLRQLAAAGVAVVVLCSPVLFNSSLVRAVLAAPAEVLQLDSNWLEGERESSFDNSLVQARGYGDGSRGMPPVEALSFQARGLVECALGPMLAFALLVIAALGWKDWRTQLAVAVLCLPTVLLLSSPAIKVQDERFVLPCVPLLVAGCWLLWDRGRPRALRAATAVVVLLTGLIQLAAWDGHLSLGPRWTGRASTANRGWSRFGDTLCSPYAAYQSVAHGACEASWNGGSVLVARTACQHMGIAWMLEEACPEGGYRCIPDDEAANRVTTAVLEHSRRHPLSILVTTDRSSDEWPIPSERLWIAEDEKNPETTLGMYAFAASIASPRSAPIGSGHAE